MKSILLTQQMAALVDDEDYERVAAKKWYARKYKRTDKWVAIKKTPKGDGADTARVKRRMNMGEFILGTRAGYISDDWLDNRKENLRAF